MNKKTCIFCSIINGNQQAVSVYEDSSFSAFMDKYPLNKGHVLVLPKKHFENILGMDDVHVGKLYTVVSVISKSMVKALNADGFNIGQNNGRSANQIVPHVHVHIIPRFNDDGSEGKWPSRYCATETELSEIAEKIKLMLPKQIQI